MFTLSRFWSPCPRLIMDLFILMSQEYFLHTNNIGIKYDFLSINIWAPIEVLKPEPEKHFLARKVWRKCLEKVFFRVPILAGKGTLPANVLKMPFPGQKLMSC